MKSVEVKGDILIVNFGGDDFHATLSLVKSIIGRKYNPEKKVWTVPNTPESKEVLVSGGFDLGEESVSSFTIDDSWKNTSITLPKMKEPFDYRGFQEEALKYVQFHDWSAYLGMPMSSGKTSMALASILKDSDLPALVICPAPVKSGFKKDYKKFFGNDSDIVVMEGGASFRRYKEKKIYICNYELFSRSIEKIEVKYRDKAGNLKKRYVERESQGLKDLTSTGFKMVICDEAHRIKSEVSSAFKAINYLVKNSASPKVLCMSGTPLLSRPSEVWTGMHLVNPAKFPENRRYAFLHRYCGPSSFFANGRQITTYNGATNTQELHALLRNNGMLVYKKEDILADLPPVVRRVVPIALDKFDDYERERVKVLTEISQDRRLALTLFERLKQLSVKHKMKHIYEYIDELLDNVDKIVVFAVHQEVIENLHKKYKNSEIYNGTLTTKQKDEAKRRFIEEKDCRLLIGNIQSLGTGVDGLQNSGSATVLFIELPWDPQTMDQAESRLSRIGHNADYISSHILVGEGTIEDEIAEKIDAKAGVFSAVIHGEELEENDLLTYLMDKYREEAKRLGIDKNKKP